MAYFEENIFSPNIFQRKPLIVESNLAKKEKEKKRNNKNTHDPHATYQWLF